MSQRSTKYPVSGVDAFGRQRTSQSTTLWDNIQEYGDNTLFWETQLVGSGTSVFLPNESSVRMRVTTTSGDKVVRQTKQYFRYQPGKSQLVMITGLLGAIKTNVRQRIGYFDIENGLFFEQNGTELRVVRRSKTTGSVVDTSVPQSLWNIDKLDGTGPSGFTLDMSKVQVFVIDFQWLGAGEVRFGVYSDRNEVLYCHRLGAMNVLDSVYMTAPNLPLRYEIENIGTSASQTDMKHICTAIGSETGFDEDKSLNFSAGNGATTISVTTRRPVFSIRPKTSFGGKTNRGTVVPDSIDISSKDQIAFYEIVFNGTLTGASFSSVDNSSITEKDVAATSITGGMVLASGYVGTGGPISANVTKAIAAKLQKLVLALNIAGDTPDILSVVVTSLATATAVGASLQWREFY